MRRPTSHRTWRGAPFSLLADPLVAADAVAILHHSPTVACTSAPTTLRRTR